MLWYAADYASIILKFTEDEYTNPDLKILKNVFILFVKYEPVNAFLCVTVRAFM